MVSAVDPAPTRPKLLFLSQTLPYPPHGGVEARTYNVLRLLARSFDIRALCFFRRGGAVMGRVSEALTALGAYGHIEAFPIPQEWSRARYVRDHAFSVLTRRVYTVFAYESRAYRARLESLLRSQRFDLVHLDSMDLSGYLPALPAVPVVCVHHNAESQLLERRATVAASPLRAWYLRHQAALMRAEETRRTSEVALNITVSKADAATLAGQAPTARFRVVPNGVDVAEFAPRGELEANSVVFLGGTSWFPNLDGMEWFCEAILPEIRRLGAAPTITWVGKATAAQRAMFRERYGVELTGYVPDVRPYVQPSTVFVVPLRFGGGTRLKILDAWAMGKAVVSTTVGCEGLDARDEENIVVRDDAPGFARAVVELLRDQPRVRRIGGAARQIAESTYSWEVIGSAMNATYLDEISGR